MAAVDALALSAADAFPEAHSLDADLRYCLAIECGLGQTGKEQAFAAACQDLLSHRLHSLKAVHAKYRDDLAASPEAAFQRAAEDLPSLHDTHRRVLLHSAEDKAAHSTVLAVLSAASASCALSELAALPDRLALGIAAGITGDPPLSGEAAPAAGVSQASLVHSCRLLRRAAELAAAAADVAAARALGAAAASASPAGVTGVTATVQLVGDATAGETSKGTGTGLAEVLDGTAADPGPCAPALTGGDAAGASPSGAVQAVTGDTPAAPPGDARAAAPTASAPADRQPDEGANRGGGAGSSGSGGGSGEAPQEPMAAEAVAQLDGIQGLLMLSLQAKVEGEAAIQVGSGAGPPLLVGAAGAAAAGGGSAPPFAALPPDALPAGSLDGDLPLLPGGAFHGGSAAGLLLPGGGAFARLDAAVAGPPVGADGLGPAGLAQLLPPGAAGLPPLRPLEPLATLEAQEQMIKNVSVAHFMQEAEALLLISEQRLFEAAGFSSFSEYIQKSGRLRIQLRQARHLVAAARFMRSLPPDVPRPRNERQVRPLTGQPAGVALAAWRLALARAEANGEGVCNRITAQCVAEVLGQMDAAGLPRPSGRRGRVAAKSPVRGRGREESDSDD
ncbi:hypothetical protein GPECTOR_3g483 [Gonium pectorale]|uniref:Uncharacterized protein n=1 Tax=Gonium pectorale TaxID=33097 RepID=A0A150H026_GONPE|nr:hypothetical protein GPECTOR_3g483 [Gonium pectorale]|eukprot:KXZ55353.1 hypothetical protein GPECTOR_3g483 [Gonium pectorale]